MRRGLYLFVFWISLVSTVEAQLQYVAPVTIRIYDSTVSLAGIHALINTKDFGFTIRPTAPPARLTSVQLIDMGRPYPPVIYQTGSENVNPQASFFPARSDFYTNIDIQANGQLTYIREDVAHGATPMYYAALCYDTATLSLAKTDIIPALDGHDYRVNSRGEVLYAENYLDTMDIGCLSGMAHDTEVVQTQRIIVKDSNNVVVFSWEPFAGDFSPCEMRYFFHGNYTAATPLDWSHFNSAIWANDNNIVVSFRYTGCFKINTHTGHVAWKLGGLDSTAISVPDSLMYFSQHDFAQLPDGRYSVYSDGDDAHKYMEGLIYEVDEVSKTARLSKRFRSADTTFSVAMGSYRLYNPNLRFINYGWYASAVLPPTTPNLFCDVFDSTDHVIASLVSPFDQIPYRVVPTGWSPEHLRPQIIMQDTVLVVGLPNTAHYYDTKWYDMPNDSTTTLVDSGMVLNSPVVGHRYIVDAYIDTNTNLNWRITSLPFSYLLSTGIKDVTPFTQLRIMPNPVTNRFCIVNDGEQVTFGMYNELGMYIRELTVKRGENVYDTPDARGVYMIKAKASEAVYRLVVY